MIGPKPFMYDVRRDTAKVAAKIMAKAPPATSSSSSRVRLHGREVMAALPTMSKGEKKELYRALQEEELQEADEANGEEKADDARGSRRRICRWSGGGSLLRGEKETS